MCEETQFMGGRIPFAMAAQQGFERCRSHRTGTTHSADQVFSDLTSSRIFRISPDQTVGSTYHTALLQFFCCGLPGSALWPPEKTRVIFGPAFKVSIPIFRVFSLTIDKSKTFLVDSMRRKQE